MGSRPIHLLPQRLSKPRAKPEKARSNDPIAFRREKSRSILFQDKGKDFRQTGKNYIQSCKRCQRPQPRF